MDIKIMVAAHKPYKMPQDEVYFPVHVGAAGKADICSEGAIFIRDDSGDNISGKNANYCELTGLYYMWKNQTYDALGLTHYRRYFARRGFGSKWSRVLTGQEIEKLLEKGSGIVLPKKRNYFIETNRSQYEHAHHPQDLIMTRQILEEKYPETLPAFDKSMEKTSGHRFNLFIMEKSLADAYCSWLFDVLFELEKRLDISDYSAYDARVFGFVSERLLDIWTDAYNHKYTEAPYVNLESQHWGRKIFGFLKRKFAGTDKK